MSIWDEWRLEHERKRKEEAPKPPAPKIGKEPVPTRPITESELIKIKRLRQVSTSWGAQDHRFIRQFEDATMETQITERQSWYIDVLWYKYRRQLGHNGPKPVGYE